MKRKKKKTMLRFDFFQAKAENRIKAKQ